MLGGQCPGEVVGGAGGVGIDFQRSPEMADRLVAAAELQDGLAEVGAEGRVAGKDGAAILVPGHIVDGEVKIITEKKEGIVKVPSETLAKRYGVYYVFVVTEGTVERREVNPGIQIDNKVEITKGLAPDEEVVIRGQTLLEDDSRIRVVDRVPGLTPRDKVQ